jgi:hypothetical protein
MCAVACAGRGNVGQVSGELVRISAATMETDFIRIEQGEGDKQNMEEQREAKKKEEHKEGPSEKEK